jgi:hypothetical protein
MAALESVPLEEDEDLYKRALEDRDVELQDDQFGKIDWDNRESIHGSVLRRMPELWMRPNPVFKEGFIRKKSEIGPGGKR